MDRQIVCTRNVLKLSIWKQDPLSQITVQELKNDTRLQKILHTHAVTKKTTNLAEMSRLSQVKICRSVLTPKTREGIEFQAALTWISDVSQQTWRCTGLNRKSNLLLIVKCIIINYITSLNLCIISQNGKLGVSVQALSLVPFSLSSVVTWFSSQDSICSVENPA